MVCKGNHPKMAELFRLVKYYNLPSIVLGEVHSFVGCRDLSENLSPILTTSTRSSVWSCNELRPFGILWLITDPVCHKKTSKFGMSLMSLSPDQNGDQFKLGIQFARQNTQSQCNSILVGERSQTLCEWNTCFRMFSLVNFNFWCALSQVLLLH